MECFVCNLNKIAQFTIFKGKYWQVDTPADIKLEGLFFIKTIRHVDELQKLNREESHEIGLLLQKYAKKSKKLSGAKRVLTWCLGLKDPHIHFWVVPYTLENESLIKSISLAVKHLANKYRDVKVK